MLQETTTKRFSGSTLKHNQHPVAIHIRSRDDSKPSIAPSTRIPAKRAGLAYLTVDTLVIPCHSRRVLGMCDHARYLITEYLDAVEEYDRIHLMLVAAARNNDNELALGHRGLLESARQKIVSAKEEFRTHRKTHLCTDAFPFQDDLPTSL